MGTKVKKWKINGLMFFASSLGKWMIVCGVELSEEVVNYYARCDSEGTDGLGEIHVNIAMSSYSSREHGGVRTLSSSRWLSYILLFGFE